MTENNKNLTPNQNLVPKQNGTSNSLAVRRTLRSGSSLHQRMSEQVARETNVELMPNRIGLMLDVSGSMRSCADESISSKTKLDYLKEALTSFVSTCNFSDTAVAIETFPASQQHRVALTSQQPYLCMTIQVLSATGCTPMHDAMSYMLSKNPITRGIIVSDGEADNDKAALDIAESFKESLTPVDCVHIGHSTAGKSLLRQIAELTGGMFIKFTDVASFSKNFKYLSPNMYGILTSGSITADELGASEVKK